jgi:hypothetical protein
MLIEPHDPENSVLSVVFTLTVISLNWLRTADTQTLDWLAWLLPAPERVRFVAEEQGNLGGLPSWRRVDHLVEVAVGIPRLAWTMRREGRRRQA